MNFYLFVVLTAKKRMLFMQGPVIDIMWEKGVNYTEKWVSMNVLIALTIDLSIIVYTIESLTNSESDEICCTQVNAHDKAGKS